MKNQAIITKLRNVDMFKTSVIKLMKGDSLDDAEEGLLLSSAIILIRDYEECDENKQSMEFAYWIILNYSLNTNEMRPLLDFAMDFGLYPICNAILQTTRLQSSLFESLAFRAIEDQYNDAGIVYTIEQANRRRTFLQEDDCEAALIAPTSFGKTRVLLDRALSKGVKERICIIVPTKSLLNQMREDIRRIGLNSKLITHDEMYKSESSFVAVLTQERAMRLLDNNPELYFDELYIDEAHKVFAKDYRAILLTRLIRESKKRNSAIHVAYFSPIINDVNHLAGTHEDVTSVNELRINFNMKEPMFTYMDSQGIFYVYNRFLDIEEQIGKYDGVWDCVKKRSSEKNLIYINRPMTIQKAANDFARYLPRVPYSEELEEISKCLEKYVHAAYDEIECIKHGVIYLHGKMLEGIKDYLVNKINNASFIKYIIANSVILEGMNLPISSLFILRPGNISKTDLINLIGRAGRLNDVFSAEPNLGKLRPEICFIDSKWNAKNRNMRQLRKKIRVFETEDKIDNPIIKHSEGKQLDKNDEETIRLEDFLLQVHSEKHDAFKAQLYRCGMHSYYSIDTDVIATIYQRLTSAKSMEWNESSLFDLIYNVFIEGLDDKITDSRVRRLRASGTREYYRKFIVARNKYPLSIRIMQNLSRFMQRAKNGNNAIEYIGLSFGEVDKNGEKHSGQSRSYVNLSEKSVNQLVSLAIVKIRTEEDFLNIDLLRMVQLLHSENLIRDSVYNWFVYGTTDSFKVELVQSGIPLSIVNWLEENGQMDQILFDGYNNPYGSDALLRYARDTDDYILFEIEKYIGFIG